MLGVFRRRRLPHWDVPDATYFATACLADSIPACGLSELRDYRRVLEARARLPSMTEADWEDHKHKLLFARLDKWLDDKPALKHLEQPALADSVQRSIYHFAAVRYHLLAYVIMPSHLHWVFHPLPQWCETVRAVSGAGFQPASPVASSPAGWKPAPRKTPAPRTPREIVMHGLKSFTGNACNRFLGRQGAFWQDESYDHWVRDEDELHRIIEYVESNPVKAKLCKSAAEYRYSSAYDRALWKIAPGVPLIPPRGAGFQPAGNNE
jgi:type I restriction enzyme R subunit